MIRRILALLVGLAVVVGLVGWWAWDRAQAAPTWYAPPDPASTDTIERAEKVEYRLAEEVQKIRTPEAPWVVRIPEASINAWLAARLPEWIMHEQSLEWPEALGVPQIHVDANGVTVAVEVNHDGRQQVLVARAVPRVVGDRLAVQVDRVGIGRVLLPAKGVETLIARVTEMLPDDLDVDAVIEVVERLLGDGESISSEIELADGRRIEVTAVRCADGAIEFENRTLARAD